MSFRDALGKQLIIADGALGTQLQAAGLGAGEAPLRWNITHPEEVLKVHCSYLEAGATLLTTNTFSTGVLMLAGEGACAEEALSSGVALAREAVEQQGADAFVALNVGPLGQLLKPLGQVPFDTAVELFARQVVLGAAAGADLVLIETMLDSYELKAAVLAAKEASDLPVAATVALNERGRMLNGADCACVCALLEGLGVDALGINCGVGPREVAPFIKEFREHTSLPLILNPNAGLPLVVDGQTTYPVGAEEFAACMRPLVEEYTAVAGGCCGTTPAHIKALAESCRQVIPQAPLPQTRRVVNSYAAAIDLEAVGELRIDRRIDPATDNLLAASLAAGDPAHALDAVFDALDDGAQIIGICAHNPGIDEARMLPALVEAVQGVVRVPLLFISADLSALERALRIYNGCALVNLSRFASDQLEAAKALSARYGAVIEGCHKGTGAFRSKGACVVMDSPARPANDT